MSHAALEGLASDPRNGVVARHSSLHIVMGREDFGDIKEALVKRLNLNMNKFYPDAGGILMGCQGIKVKKSSSEVSPTSLLNPVFFRAQFYLFQPQVGSDLFCVVHTREEGRVTCLVHKVFMVDVANPSRCWETVFVGQTVMVKVEAVEQLAWQEPKILASLVEVTGDDIIPLIEFVDKFESVTDSGMIEYELNHTRKSQGQNDSQASSTSMGIAREDGWLQSSSKKRKGLEDSPNPVTSPAKKKPMKDSNPRRNSKPSPPVTDTKSVRKTRYNSKSSSTETGSAVPPSDQHLMPPPLATKTSPKNKSPANIFSQILAKPAISKSGDSGHESSDDDEVDNAETTSKATEPTVEGISKSNPNPANDTVEVNLMPFEALQAQVSPTNVGDVPKPAKTSKARRAAPPGFQNVENPKNTKKRVKLVWPHVPGRSFLSYKAAWTWVDANPDYLTCQVEDEPESCAGAGVGARSEPDMPHSQPEAVEITQVVTENLIDRVPEVPQMKPKQPKLPKKFVPTPVVRSSQQKLLVDPPSFSESDAEPAQVQFQSPLIPESDTEYQSQSLLALATKVAKKTQKVVKNSPKAGLNKSRLMLSKKSPKSGLSKSRLKFSINSPNPSPQKAQASSSRSSVSKLPGKAFTDDDSGADFAPEPTKQVKISRKIAPTQSPSYNMSTTTRTSSDSSSSDSSSDKDLPSQSKSGGKVTTSHPKVSASDSSSSYELDSSADAATVMAPKSPTRPSDSLAKTGAVSRSSDSDSDSSEESEFDVKKFDYPVTVIETDPVASTAAAKVSGEPVKKVENASKQDSSSSSESETEVSQKHPKQKKLTKKNSPKPIF